MEQNVIQIKGGTKINVDVSVKNIYVKNNMIRIMLHVIVKIKNFYQVLWMIQLSFMMKLRTWTRKLSRKTEKQVLMKKNITFETQNFYILLAFLLSI